MGTDVFSASTLPLSPANVVVGVNVVFAGMGVFHGDDAANGRAKARCAVQSEPVGGGGVVVVVVVVVGAIVVVVVVVEVVVVVDVVVVLVVDVLLVVVVGGGSVDGTPVMLSTSVLMDTVAFADENVVTPIEPATWSAVWLSVTWAVHGLGSAAPVGHTLARTVVGLAPTAWNRTVADEVGDTRAPAMMTWGAIATSVPGAVRLRSCARTVPSGDIDTSTR